MHKLGAAVCAPEDFDRACDWHLRTSSSKPADIVCRKGEPVEHWFGVIDGLAKMSSDWAYRQDRQLHRHRHRRLVRRGLDAESRTPPLRRHRPA
jgi:hypothetical protein